MSNDRLKAIRGSETVTKNAKSTFQPRADASSGQLKPLADSTNNGPKKQFIMYTSQRAFHETSLQQFNTLTNRKEAGLLIDRFVKNKPSNYFTPELPQRLNQQSKQEDLDKLFAVEIKHEPAKEETAAIVPSFMPAILSPRRPLGIRANFNSQVIHHKTTKTPNFYAK